MKKRLLVYFAALAASVSLLSGCVINLPSEKYNSKNEELQKQIEALSAELSELRGMLTLEPGVLEGEGTELSAEEAAELSGLFTMEEMDMLASPSGSAITPRDWSRYTTPSAKKVLTYNEATFYDRLDKVCRDYLNSSFKGGVSRNGTTRLRGVRYSDILTEAQAKKVFLWFRRSNPQYFFINNTWSYSDSDMFIHIGDYVTSLRDPVRSANELFDKLDSWIEECSDNETTTWDKVLAANKKICESVIYTPAVSAGDMQAAGGKNQSMFSVLMTEDTVCAGYASTFAAMTNAMGIDTFYVSSDDHAWNATRFDDGNYYFVDVCWNDLENGYDEKFIGVGTDYAASRDGGSSSHVYETDFANWSPLIPRGDYMGADNALLEAPAPRVTGSGSRAVKLGWNAVDNAESYEFSITDGEKIIYSGTTKKTELYTVLPEGVKSAEAKIRAIGTKNGFETKSDWAEVTASASNATGKPAAPTNVKVEPREGAQLWITWDTAKRADSTVYLRFKDDTFSTVVSDFSSEFGNLYYTGWKKQDLYFCLMSVKQSGSKEIFSDPAYFKYSVDGVLTPVSGTGSQTPKIDAPTGLKASADGKFVTCAWTPISGVDGYDFQVSYNAGFSDIWGSATFKPEYNQATFTAPDGKDTAFMRIRSFKKNGGGKIYSDWETASCGIGQTIIPEKPAKPAAPTGFKGEAISKDMSKFTWNAVPGASGYNLALFRDAAHKELWTDYSVTETAFSLSPFVEGRIYYFGIRSVKSENGVDVYSDYVYLEYTHKYNAPSVGAEQATKTYADGSVYVGQMKDGKRDGFGTLTFSSGSVYTGEWKNDLKDGYGVFTWSDGDIYEGEWKNDRRIGHGKYIWANGDVYTGEFNDNQPNGIGTYAWVNGNVYEGEFKDGKRDGHGKTLFASGNVYEGEFKDDKECDGIGKFTWTDGSFYEGEIKNGRMDGYGRYTWANGSFYEGGWKNDVRHGVGKFTGTDGKTVAQVWNEGKKVS